MYRIVVFSLLLFLAFHGQASINALDTVNRVNKIGKRVGYWILTEDNQPTTANNSNKRKEGRYINGRKNGAWVFYFEDAKTVRLIGEFNDNRPRGAYFRFNKNGEIKQASAVSNSIDLRQYYETYNPIFACRLMFNNRETVAGQVFFRPKVFPVPYSYNFWVENEMESVKTVKSEVSFNWLSSNYAELYANYLKIRTPRNHIAENNTALKEVAKKINRLIDNDSRAVTKGVNAPPHVIDPRVGKGMVFQPNGFNKLYTKSDEIWIDGYFKSGQLKDGKVFLYDQDGVLLKVRVYKDGKYVSDGGL